MHAEASIVVTSRFMQAIPIPCVIMACWVTLHPYHLNTTILPGSRYVKSNQALRSPLKFR